MFKFFRSLCSHNVTFVTFVMSVITLIVLKHTLYSDHIHRRKMAYVDQDYVDVPHAAADRWSRKAEGRIMLFLFSYNLKIVTLICVCRS